jgi:hypothetical protein
MHRSPHGVVEADYRHSSGAHPAASGIVERDPCCAQGTAFRDPGHDFQRDQSAQRHGQRGPGSVHSIYQSANAHYRSTTSRDQRKDFPGRPSSSDDVFNDENLLVWRDGKSTTETHLSVYAFREDRAGASRERGSEPENDCTNSRSGDNIETFRELCREHLAGARRQPWILEQPEFLNEGV